MPGLKQGKGSCCSSRLERSLWNGWQKTGSRCLLASSSWPCICSGTEGMVATAGAGTADMARRTNRTSRTATGTGLEQVLPAFKWLTWWGFLLGLVESFLYGAYAGLVFCPIYNWLYRRFNARREAK